MQKARQEREDQKNKGTLLLMFQQQDYTKEISGDNRQLDAFALLTNGDNICTAAGIYNDELFIANNTNKKDELIQLYTDFFIDVIEKKEVNILEKRRLVNLSYTRERERVIKAHWLGGVEKKIKALNEDPEKYVKASYEKMELEIKSLEHSLKKEEERLTSFDFEPDEETKSKMAELEKERETECQVQKDLINEYKALQVLKKNGEDIEEKKIEHESKKSENILRLKAIKYQLAELRNTAAKSDSKDTIHRTKVRIELLNKNLEKSKAAKIDDVLKKLKKDLQDEKKLAEEDLEYKRGHKFKKRLRRAMERILNSLLNPACDSQFSLKMLKNITFVSKKDVHAEMSIIDTIWEKVKASGKEFFSQNIYIGLSKLCCFKCMNTISQINQAAKKLKDECQINQEGLSENNFIQTRGAHHKTYGKWESPNISNILDLKHPDQILMDLRISEDDFRTQTNNNIEDPEMSLSVIEISSDEECEEDEKKE